MHPPLDADTARRLTLLTLAVLPQVLRPGGRFLCLEFSQVVLPGLKELYEAYSFNVIPQIGRCDLAQNLGTLCCAL